MQNPKHILITGASSGIGAALAELYAAPGVRLSLHGRHEARLETIAGRARQKGATVNHATGDVTDDEAMAVYVKRCHTLQAIDLVIANAGISAGTSGRGESEEQVKAIFAVNWGGVMNTVSPLVPLMMQRGGGQIALMSSLAGFRGYAGAPAYCASKAAVRVYGEGLRGELAPLGIDVNVICPGFIKTPMTDVNDFPMPFLISAEKAAVLIRHGLAQNRPRIAFPWPMYAMARLMSVMPQRWVDGGMRRFRKKAV